MESKIINLNIDLCFIAPGMLQLFTSMTGQEQSLMVGALKEAAEDYYFNKPDKTEGDNVRLCFEASPEKYLKIESLIKSSEQNIRLMIFAVKWITTDEFLDYLNANKGNLRKRDCRI